MDPNTARHAPVHQAVSLPEPRTASPREIELTEAQAKQPVAVVVLMISWGVFIFFCLLCHYLPGGVSENEERSLFVFGGVGAPLGALALGWLFTRLHQRFFRRSSFYPIALALAHTCFWTVSLYQFRRFQPTATNHQLIVKAKVHIAAFIALNVLVAMSCWLEQRIRWSASARLLARRVADDGYYLVPPLAAAAVAAFCDYHLTQWASAVALVAMGLSALASKRYVRLVPGKWESIFLDASAVGLIALVVFDAGYQVDIHHYSFYFGPTASLLGGRRPLVDINCQYGVGVLYFLAALIKLHLIPATYQGMSAAFSCLGVAHFTIFYVLLRCCIPSRAYCLLGLTVALAVRLFGGATFYVMYPSMGPVRFIGGYLVLVLAALRYRVKSRGNLFRGLELAAFALGSVWSVETFAGVTVTFLSIILYESCSMAGGVRARLLHGARWIGAAALVMALAHGVLTLEIRWHAHEWPHWSRYFDYLIFYSKFSSWALPVKTWDPWAPIALVYGASITAALARLFVLRGSKSDPTYGIVLGAAALGMVEFSYYIGRSHIETLHVFLPHFFLGAYWLQRVARESPQVPSSFRTSFLYCAYAAIGILLLSTLPGFASRFRQSALGYIASDQAIRSPWALSPNALWRGSPQENQQSEAVQLVRKYEPTKPRVGLFMEQAVRNQALLELGKGYLWPISQPDEDGIEPHARSRILAFVPDTQPGDVIFVGTNVNAFEELLLAKLKTRFHFAELEASPSGIKAIKLETL